MAMKKMKDIDVSIQNAAAKSKYSKIRSTLPACEILAVHAGRI
jgi:hypothetical protein